MKNKIVKKLIMLSMIGAVSVSLIACGNKSSNKDGVEAIKENGKVVVGLSADYAPYEFHAVVNGKDETVGFDVELAKEVAKDLDVELEIKEMEFDALIGALQAGQIDMIISGMNPDEERKKQIDFSEIYYESKHGVLVSKDETEKYKKVEDLNGKKIGAQLGSTQQKIVESEIKAESTTLLPNVNNLVLELKSKKVDAIVTEEPVAKMAIKSNPELALSDIKFEAEGGGNAVGVKKNSGKLVEQINSTIKRLQDSGELDQFIMDANDLAAQNQQ